MRTANKTAEWSVIPDHVAESPGHFKPGELTERRALLLKCREAVDVVHYLTPVRQRTSIDKRRMAILRAELLGGHLRLDAVKADIEKAWTAIVRENASAMVRTVDCEDGFDFCFALFRKDGIFVTGVIEIRKPGSKA